MFLRKNNFLVVVFIISAIMSQAQNKPVTNTEAIFNFNVSSISGKPRQGDLIILKSKASGKNYQGLTGKDGNCSITIPSGEKYVIYYKLLTDTIKYQEIDVPAGQRMAYTLKLKYDPPKKFTLKNIFFETGLSTLRKESFPALNELVEVMKSKTTLVIEIGGHSDNAGNKASNQKLSTDRAKAVRDYLIKHGIDPKRVTAVGYGDTLPVASNETPEGRQQNRRTEVRIVSE
jgi:OmpA-OmpF porin, OOP family